MSRAFTKEDHEAPKPRRNWALPARDDPSFDEAAAAALLEGARVSEVLEAEEATGYAWGEPRLRPFVERRLGVHAWRVTTGWSRSPSAFSGTHHDRWPGGARCYWPGGKRNTASCGTSSGENGRPPGLENWIVTVASLAFVSIRQKDIVPGRSTKLLVSDDIGARKSGLGVGMSE